MALRASMAPTVDLEDSLEDIQEYFHSHRYTDGLPIIPPTEERVKRFIECTKRDPREIIGEMPPLWAHVTVERIATNAVMAGCKPEYMPVLIAAVEAICPPPGTRPGAAEQDPLNLHGAQTTTNPVCPIFFVNGPIRKELEINCGAGVMGPGFRANISIGRAVRLMLINVGGALPGDVSKSTHAWPGRFGLVIGEFEEESPWDPMHVDKGFNRDDSVVTAVLCNGVEHIANTSEKPESIVRSLTTGVNKGGIHGDQVTMIIPPTHARQIASLGFTKDAFKKHIYENARIPLEYATLSLERYEMLKREMEHFGHNRGGYRRVDDAGRLIPCYRWEDVHIVIAGNEVGFHDMILETHSFSGALDTWISRVVQKP